MDSHAIARGEGPENSAYDRQRHDSMKLRPSGMDGIKFMPAKFESIFPGTCEKCVFGLGEHGENCPKSS